MKLHFIVLVGCLFVMTPLTQPNNYSCARADSNYTYIGKLLTYEHVSSRTKVYIPNSTIMSLVNEAGRTVYTDDPFGPINKRQNGLNSDKFINRDLDSPDYLQIYYYYATPSEPKITGFRNMYNDVDSLIFALQLLESEATYFNVSDPKNAILSYIRSINKNYAPINL